MGIATGLHNEGPADKDGPNGQHEDSPLTPFNPTEEELTKFDDDLANARMNIYIEDPHIFNLGSRLKTQYAPPLKSSPEVRGYTNGANISLTPAWLAATEEEQTTTLAHEIGHVMMRHIARAGDLGGSVDMKKLNIAADLSLIPLQVRMGQTPVITTFYPNWEDYGDMSMEDIYHKLVGDNDDSNYDPQHPEPDEIEADQPSDEEVADVDSAINQAAMQAQQAGCTTAASIASGRLVNLTRAKKIPWDKYLQSVVSKTKTKGTTWSRPSRRLRSLGVIMPGKKKAKEFKVCMAVDVSGSVGEIALGKFMFTAHDVLTKYASQMHLITFDDKIVDEWHLTPKDPVTSLKMNGWGGTYPEKVYEHLKKIKSDHKLLVIATDGGLTVPPDPGYPVIWLITDNPGFTSPYGTVIHLDTNKL